MKLLALLSSSAVLVIAFAQQDAAPTLPEPLASALTKLSTAKTLKVHFTKRLVGGAADAMTLEMAKDNKFKLTYTDGFIVSDGKSVYTYKKTGNTYTQVDTTDKSVAKFRSRLDVLGWEAFFQTKPGSDIVSATAGADKMILGQTTKTVNVTLKPGNREASYFISSATGVPAGFDVKIKDKEWLILADKVEVGDGPLPDKDFTFEAPEGATLVKDTGSDFASIQQLMTDNCMPCHSADHKRAGVDLSSYDGISAAVKSGDSANSLLVKAVKGDGVDLMPKGRGPLTSDQIASLAAWIDAGAKNE
jgi:outer membrane lipoprotein-sorting protein